MQTTFTLARGRVANAGDFLALGEGRHKTPSGWQHLSATWTPGQESEAAIADMDGCAVALAQGERAAVERHLRAFVNLHGAAIEAAR